jgi:hypothetical protein
MDAIRVPRVNHYGRGRLTSLKKRTGISYGFCRIRQRCVWTIRPGRRDTGAAAQGRVDSSHARRCSTFCRRSSDSALVPSPSPNSTNAYGRKRSSTRQTCRSSSANPSRAGRFGAQAYLHSPAHGFGYALLRQAAGVDEPAGSRICGSTRCLVSRTRQVALHQGENIVGREPSSEVWLGAHSISRTRIIVTTREITAVEGAAKQEWHLAEAAPH